MAGPVVGADGRGDDSLRRLAGDHRGSSRTNLSSGTVCRRSIRGRFRVDGSAGGDRGQPGAAGGAGRHQLPWAEHPGDHGHRGALHGDVVSGRPDDGHLRDGFSAGRRVASADPGALDQRWWHFGGCGCCHPGGDEHGDELRHQPDDRPAELGPVADQQLERHIRQRTLQRVSDGGAGQRASSRYDGRRYGERMRLPRLLEHCSPSRPATTRSCSPACPPRC